MRVRHKASLIIGTFVGVAATACGKSSAVDTSLASDLAAASGKVSSLELAPQSSESRLVVSAVEAGPEASPAPRAPRAPAAKPTTHAAPRHVAPKAPAPRAPAHTSVATAEPAPEPAPRPQPKATHERAPDPAPLPSMPSTGRERQHGTYSTEAEIFRQMPWIRP